MAGELLLVGSIPLDTPEQVFRRVGGPLGPYLAYMPDGEVGDRRYWIDGIAYRVFNGHPEIETLRRPAPDANGVENWRPLGMHDQFQVPSRGAPVKLFGTSVSRASPFSTALQFCGGKRGT